jgi:hypothetical protein
MKKPPLCTSRCPLPVCDSYNPQRRTRGRPQPISVSSYDNPPLRTRSRPEPVSASDSVNSPIHTRSHPPPVSASDSDNQFDNGLDDDKVHITGPTSIDITCLTYGHDRKVNNTNYFFCHNCDVFEEKPVGERSPI